MIPNGLLCKILAAKNLQNNYTWKVFFVADNLHSRHIMGDTFFIEVVICNKKNSSLYEISDQKRKLLSYPVGAIGFEPTVSYTPCKRVTGLRHAPIVTAL